jgi:hypothetical protein
MGRWLITGSLRAGEGMVVASPTLLSKAPKPWDRFNSAMKSVIAVPHRHAEIQRRVAEHKKEAARNPNRRGPKPKRQSR